ncbi:ATP-grasp domain-containing protein [Streptomyces achromogenes]|uniref:ATP-grasp domain-containing protein n=1 Tax=Streptomyces achromogenes TaxID=67255 RepID=UPI00068ADA78|nr:ATP-grasp domain-containing protein [Streptomyces achromogenes]
MTKRVCLVSPKPPMLQRARQQKLDVVCVYTPEEFRTVPPSALEDETCLVLRHREDPRAMVEAVRALHARAPFSAVFTVQEEGVVPAALLNDELGLNGVHSDTVALLTDKWRMRQHTAAQGVSTVRAALATDVTDITEFGAAVGYPLIAKPVGGSASLAIHKIENAAEAERVHAALAEVGMHRFLLEEYLEGPEISVDVMSFAGRHVVIAIADKITGAGFLEYGHSIPAVLDAGLEAEVSRTVGAFLDSVGLRDGLSHTEVKLTPAGPKVVEGHNRRGGDRINTMTELVYGIDLEAAGLAWMTGESEPLTARPAAKCGAAVAFFEAEPGRVVAIDGADEVRDHPAVVEFHLQFAVGQVAPPVRWSPDRAGYLVVTAETGEAASALARSLAGRIRFTTEPVDNDADELRRQRDLLTDLDQADYVDVLEPRR